METEYDKFTHIVNICLRMEAIAIAFRNLTDAQLGNEAYVSREEMNLVREKLGITPSKLQF